MIANETKEIEIMSWCRRKKIKKDLLKEFGKALLVSALMFAVKSLEDKGTANREEDFEIIDEEEYEDGD